MGLQILPVELPLTELKQWAVDAESRGVWTLRRAECFPLPNFPDEHLARIRADVEFEKKPPFWLDLGFAQIPSRSWSEWHWQRGIDPDKRRPALSPALRQFVIERDGYVCGLCGGEVEPSDVHIDHIHPYSKGGQDVAGNLQVAHSLCNIRKGARV
jgi:hypothetical protein